MVSEAYWKYLKLLSYTGALINITVFCVVPALTILSLHAMAVREGLCGCINRLILEKKIEPHKTANLRPDFTLNLEHELAFGQSKFDIAPYGKIKVFLT